jgi:hypothetical protein
MCRISEDQLSRNLEFSAQQNAEFGNRAEAVVHAVLVRPAGPAKRQRALVGELADGALDGAYGALQDLGEPFLRWEGIGVLALEVLDDDEQVVGFAGQPEECGLDVLDHIPAALK